MSPFGRRLCPAGWSNTAEWWRIHCRGLRGPSMGPAPTRARRALGPAIRLSGFAPGESVEPPSACLVHRLSAGQTQKAAHWAAFCVCLAERGGFEPPKRGLDAYTLSRRAPSTTRTPLRTCCIDAAGAQILAGECDWHKHHDHPAGGLDRRGTMDVPMKTVA